MVQTNPEERPFLFPASAHAPAVTTHAQVTANRVPKPAKKQCDLLKVDRNHDDEHRHYFRS